MFKLDLSPTYAYPVKFTVIDENGNQKTHQIKALFKRFNRDALIELQNESTPDRQSIKSADEILNADIEYLRKFMDGWQEVEINGSQQFNDEQLRLLLNQVPQISTAITEAFFESAAGGQKRKN
jgi:hypothetical protein